MADSTLYRRKSTCADMMNACEETQRQNTNTNTPHIVAATFPTTCLCYHRRDYPWTLTAFYSLSCLIAIFVRPCLLLVPMTSFFFTTPSPHMLDEWVYLSLMYPSRHSALPFSIDSLVFDPARYSLRPMPRSTHTAARRHQRPWVSCHLVPIPFHSIPPPGDFPATPRPIGSASSP